VLRGIFEPKRGEEIGGWRKVHNEELRNLHSLQNKSGIITSRKMRLAWNVTRMRRRGTFIGYWWESQKEIGH
jgi:hypothetical protein